MALHKAIQVEWVAANMEASGRIKGYRYRSEEHTSELQSHVRISYAVFCLKKKKKKKKKNEETEKNITPQKK